MQTTKLFNENVKAFDEGYDLIVHSGGQASGKTISNLQFIFFLNYYSQKPLLTSVVSYALPHLKGGAIKDFETILTNEGFNVESIRNKSENWSYKLNKSKVEFFGTEGTVGGLKAHGPRRDILFINEANNKIDYESYDMLNSRTHRLTIIDFNPRSEFWFHEKIQPNFKHKFIKSNFTDNPYIPERELQNIFSKFNKPGFENWWKVYGLGELGTLEGAILTNWHYGEFNNDLSYSFGLDFGMKDPDAMVKVAIDRLNYKIYAKQLIYKSNQSTNELAHEIIKHVKYNELIIADSASPRTIQDLKSQGLNVIGVTKFAGSVMESIKLIQDYEIIVDNESYDLGKELQNWIWIDKRGGIPLDANNHLIDSLLYNVSTIIKPHKKKSVQILNR
jgi:phage terminase large subunit